MISDSNEWKSLTETYHAHFDCFSGAAGDMLLAACLDASDDPHALLRHVKSRLMKGLPDIADEFDISVSKVQRGRMASIAALYLEVQSRYDHAPVPIPCNPKSSHNISANHSHNHDHEKEYDHHHNHDHVQHIGANHVDAHAHTHDHEKQQVHDHDHEYIHENNVQSHKDEIGQKHLLKHLHANANANDHCHQHSHDHDHEPKDVDTNHLHNDHSHNQSSSHRPLRNLPQIRSMLLASSPEFLDPWVRDTAIQVFTELAHAEAQTHGAELDTVHFHEVGAIDSIVDTVGTLIALHALGVKSVTCSRLPLGEGTCWGMHGLMPVPAPATLRLLQGMPTTPGPPGVTGELVTPTGAALLRVLVQTSPNQKIPGRPPCFTIRAIGHGAGTKDFEKHPNIVRLLLGDSVEFSNQRLVVDSVGIEQL